MNTDQLRCFCAVVEQQSFTRAARSLFLSQPAVSQQVQALERGLGIPLLDRSRRPLTPTEAGESVYHYGVELLERESAIHNVIDQFKGLHGGRIALAAGTVVGQYVLPPLIARFRHRYPDVRVQLSIMRTPAVFEQVLRGTVDLGVGVRQQVPDGLVVQRLYRDEIVLVVGPRHHWARRGRKPLPLSLLGQQALIAPISQTVSSRQYYERRLREAGMEPRIAMEFDTPEAVKRVVIAGEGVALLPGHNVAPEVAAGLLRVVPVEGLNLHTEYVSVWRPRQYFSPALARFVEFLRSELRPGEDI